jgi:hypothetical protein
MDFGLSDGQNQSICLRKDLIFDLPWDLEPFTTVFDNSVVYRDSARAADEKHRGSRRFEPMLDLLVIYFHARKGEQRSIFFVYVETSISGQVFNADLGSRFKHSWFSQLIAELMTTPLTLQPRCQVANVEGSEFKWAIPSRPL